MKGVHDKGPASRLEDVVRFPQLSLFRPTHHGYHSMSRSELIRLTSETRVTCLVSKAKRKQVHRTRLQPQVLAAGLRLKVR